MSKAIICKAMGVSKRREDLRESFGRCGKMGKCFVSKTGHFRTFPDIGRSLSKAADEMWAEGRIHSYLRRCALLLNVRSALGFEWSREGAMSKKEDAKGRRKVRLKKFHLRMIFFAISFALFAPSRLHFFSERTPSP